MDHFLIELENFLCFLKDLFESVCSCLKSEPVDKPIITYNWNEMQWNVDVEMIEKKHFSDMI
jgi:hypothetical protein